MGGPSGTIHLCHQDRGFLESLSGARFTEPLDNDSHNSLHEPLTAENKRPRKGEDRNPLLLPYRTWKDDNHLTCWQKPGADLHSRRELSRSGNVKHLCRSEKPQLDDKQQTRITESTAMTIRIRLPDADCEPAAREEPVPLFSPHYSYLAASANGHQRAASFCHAPCSHLISPCCVCVCVTVTCVSALPSERHTNRWGVERPRAILWQKRFPSFVPRADGTDGLSAAQSRPEGGHRPSLIGVTNEHSGASPFLTPLLLGLVHPNLKTVVSSCEDSFSSVITMKKLQSCFRTHKKTEK